jgi:signal transduction histidine kinase
MKAWFRGQGGGSLAFLVIVTLVVGGLGWATVAALRLENEQLKARTETEQQNRLRLALWRLDSLVAPALAKEDSRPYNHYSAVFAPPTALGNDGQPLQPGTVLEPSPLLSAELPDWMLLHFQLDASGWRSPQVLSPTLATHLHNAALDVSFTNATPERNQLLAELRANTSVQAVAELLQESGTRAPLVDMTLVPGASNTYAGAANNEAQNSLLQQGGQRADSEYLNRQGTQFTNQARIRTDNSAVALENLSRNGENWFVTNPSKRKRTEQVLVSLGPMVPCWLEVKGQPERLICARYVQIGTKDLYQGIVLDWPRLQKLLVDAVRDDLFSQASLQPLREAQPEQSERAMAFLPIQLDPGPFADATPPDWTPLRVGLLLSWAAALVALLAVALGGWSLIDLSERRIRFVSAVTHELRTPLTTLRLYLDMLTGGIITEPKEKEEYLQTLNVEADRLHRLVGNVLDFSRLEKQRPTLMRTRIKVRDLIGQIRSTWEGPCKSANKELVLDFQLATEREMETDVQVVQQVVGNLIDNACKYSRGASDPRIWLRAREEPQMLVIEVEDRGPGVPQKERRSIFRPFSRGRDNEVTGGAGLGLALAKRWARLLGGSLSLGPFQNGQGACFRLTLPLASASS